VSARWLLVLGGLLCIPAVAGIVVFAAGAADADALHAAPVCRTPDRFSSTCLSVLGGTILERHPGGPKSLPSVTVAVDRTTADAGYECGSSPAGACDGLSFEAGTEISTGWWKGSLVALGPPGAVPRVVTDQSPEDHLGIEAFLLGLVIPAVSFLIGGFMRLRRPATVAELFQGALAREPEPPRSVDRRLVQRVAWGGYAWMLPVAWGVLYLIPAMLALRFMQQERWAPAVLVATFVIALLLSAWTFDAYLSDLIRTAARRTIEVKKVELVSRRGFEVPVLSYELLDGRTATYPLDTGWKGGISSGDHLDALTNGKSGSIRRLLSLPPAQA
jgi:hypothetical protein